MIGLFQTKFHIGAPFLAGSRRELAQLELRSQQALIEPVHFFKRKEMKFNLSFASALLDSDFGPECLFESVNGGLNIRINGAAPACRIILAGSGRIPCNQALCLTNR